MSATILSRSRGSIVRCNDCGVTSTTGQIEKRLHREYLRTTGWGRGSVAGTKTRLSTKRHDLCPACLKTDRALSTEHRRESNERRALRDANRKARAVGKKAA